MSSLHSERELCCQTCWEVTASLTCLMQMLRHIWCSHLRCEGKVKEASSIMTILSFVCCSQNKDLPGWSLENRKCQGFSEIQKFCKKELRPSPQFLTYSKLIFFWPQPTSSLFCYERMSRVCLVYSLKETAEKNKCRLFYFDQIKGNCSSERKDSLCLSANTKELLQSCLLSPLTGCWMCFCCYSFVIYVQNPISNLHN